MSTFIDLTGKKFNHLQVISRGPNNKRNQAMWNCICDCGTKTLVLGHSLTHGKTKSCGCQKSKSAHKTHFEDLTGKRFGKLVVKKRADNQNKRTMWLCRCDCGEETIVEAYSLKTGNTSSCGCLKFESHNATHSLSKTRLYGIYSKMKGRCYNSNDPAYKWYGGRGISICEEWLNNFESFYGWAINNGYSEELSIDRIDVNGNYEPCNCRWATITIQANNRRNTKFLIYHNETKSIAEWSRITGIKYSTIVNRLKLGYTNEECLEMPIHAKR